MKNKKYMKKNKKNVQILNINMMKMYKILKIILTNMKIIFRNFRQSILICKFKHKN